MDTITWHIEESQSSVYLKKKIQVDKYSFHIFGGEYFDDKKFREKQAGAKKEGKYLPEPDHSFCISWEVKSGEANQLKLVTIKELKIILNLLTLQTDLTFHFGQFDHHPGDDRRASHHTDVILQSPSMELEEKLLQQTLAIQKKIGELKDEKAELMNRTIDWYSRGNKEIDLINSFANIWIGFEVLTFWFGNGPAYICPKCSTKLQDSSIRGRIKEFLKQLNLSSEEKSAMELYEIRNKLFHQAKEFQNEKRTQLQQLLKKCIFACLEL